MARRINDKFLNRDLFFQQMWTVMQNYDRNSAFLILYFIKFSNKNMQDLKHWNMIKLVKNNSS